MPAEAPFESTGVGRPASRPNIVIVLADDLGAGDLGCYGSLSIQTPRLDRLAAEGLRFTDGYSTAPTCSPTRIALYTGRYPHRLLVGMEEPLGTRDEHHGIPHDHPTLPSLLKDAGYATAMFGKWHCGWLPWFSPVKAGFETFFGNLDGAMDYFSHIDTAGLPDLYEGEVAVDEVGYYTDLITDRAVDFIKLLTEMTRHRGQPFTLLGNLRTDEKGRMDIKKYGLLPIFTASRVLAIRHDCRKRSTGERLEALAAKGIGEEALVRRIIEAQSILLGAVLAQQLADLEAGTPLSPAIVPARLDKSGRARLKHALGAAHEAIGLATEGLW